MQPTGSPLLEGVSLSEGLPPLLHPRLPSPVWAQEVALSSSSPPALVIWGTLEAVGDGEALGEGASESKVDGEAEELAEAEIFKFAVGLARDAYAVALVTGASDADTSGALARGLTQPRAPDRDPWTGGIVVLRTCLTSAAEMVVLGAEWLRQWLSRNLSEGDASAFSLMRSESCAVEFAHHALVVGNNRYSHNPLRQCVSDARDVAVKWARFAYRTTLLLNGSDVEVQDALDRYRARLRPGNTAVVYFAGHGELREGQFQLIAVEGPSGAPPTKCTMTKQLHPPPPPHPHPTPSLPPRTLP